MTTPKRSPEFLKCINCHELFNNPVTLQCGHTFCAECVDEHTSYKDDADDRRNVSCHVCNLPVTNTNPPKTSFFIKRLAEEYKPNRKDEHKACRICKDDGDTRRAKVWCSYCGYGMCGDCQKVHKRVQPSHTISDIADREARIVRPKCEKHEDFLINQFCEDCKEAMCQKCYVTDHRGCKMPIDLDESLSKIDPLLNKYTKELENNMPKMKSRLSDFESKEETLRNERDEAEKAINETGDMFVAEIRKQQQQLKEQLLQSSGQTLDLITDEVKTGKLRLLDAQQRIGLAKEAENSASAMDHFEVYKIFHTLRDSERQIKEPGKGDGGDVTFKDNSDTFESLKIGRIGELKGTTEVKINPSKNNGRSLHVRFEDNTDTMVSLKTGKIGELKGTTLEKGEKSQIVEKIDTEKTGIRGITVLSLQGTKVILVTYPKESLLLTLYTKNGKLKNRSLLKLPTSGYDITQLEADTAAMTMPKKNQIGLIRVGPKGEDKPILKKIIKTDMQYIGLTRVNTDPVTLAVSGARSGFIEIIDLSGNRLVSFGANAFSTHIFLCSSKDNNLWVSDADQISLVLCKMEDGDWDGKYHCHPREGPDFSKPCGISEGARGDIFVVDRGNGHKVVQLDERGNYVRDILLSLRDGIYAPYCLHVDCDNVMYVSVEGRFIYVFDIDED